MRLTYEDKASIKLDRQQKNINPVVVKVHGGHIKQLFIWLSSCCMMFSLFYLDIHASTHFQLCFTIVIQYSLGALNLWYYLLITSWHTR